MNAAENATDATNTDVTDAVETEIAEQPTEAEGESMPMGKDGEPLFMEVSPERTHEYIFSDPDLDRETAKTFVDNKINEAKKAIEKLGAEEEKAKKNIGTNLTQFKQKMQGLKQKKADAEKAQEYWEAVKNMQERIEAKEAGEKARKQAELTDAAIAKNIENNDVATENRSDVEELADNGTQFVVADNGTTIFGTITEDCGLQEAPIKLSKGFHDSETGKGNGLAHIEARHGAQIREAGFESVIEFVSFVSNNYDHNNIRVGKRRDDGTPTYLIQVTNEHDNVLFIELSKDGSYWNVNSGGVLRKGYSNKKETVAKTEPQQPNNAVSSGSSLSEGEQSGKSTSEPNGKPTVSISSEGKDNISAMEKQEEGVKSSEQKTSVDNSEAFAGLPDSSLQSMVRNNERELSKLPADSPKREALQRIVDSAKAELAKRGDVQKDVRGGEDEPGESEVSGKLGEAVVGLAKDAGLDVVTDIAEGERVLGDMVNLDVKADIVMMEVAKRNPSTLPAKERKSSSPTIAGGILSAKVVISDDNRKGFSEKVNDIHQSIAKSEVLIDELERVKNRYS